MNETPFRYGQDTLRTSIVIDLAARTRVGTLSAEIIAKIKASQQHVADIVSDNTTVYGVNTFFGILANTRISEEDTRILQHKILQSHSVGVGAPIPVEVAKIMLITKVHALARGYSGVQLETIERIL